MKNLGKLLVRILKMGKENFRTLELGNSFLKCYL